MPRQILKEFRPTERQASWRLLRGSVELIDQLLKLASRPALGTVRRRMVKLVNSIAPDLPIGSGGQSTPHNE